MRLRHISNKLLGTFIKAFNLLKLYIFSLYLGISFNSLVWDFDRMYQIILYFYECQFSIRKFRPKPRSLFWGQLGLGYEICLIIQGHREGKVSDVCSNCCLIYIRVLSGFLMPTRRGKSMAFNPFYIRYLTLFSLDIWSSPSRRYIFRSRKFSRSKFLS